MIEVAAPSTTAFVGVATVIAGQLATDCVVAGIAEEVAIVIDQQTADHYYLVSTASWLVPLASPSDSYLNCLKSSLESRLLQAGWLHFVANSTKESQ